MRSLLTLLLAAVAQAQTVTYSNIVVIGFSTNGVENFNGVPFAAPPTGTLRLKPPQTFIAPASTTVTATGTPRACPQFQQQTNQNDLGSQAQNILNQIGFLLPAPNQGEDCLTLSIQRSPGTNQFSNLPVLVSIYGGAFEIGSTSNTDASYPIKNANTLGKPFVFVQMNYRVGGFGFLAGSQLSADGSTNLGLRDQRLAMQWVSDNIAKFGGDPTKITLFGESAGAISVYDQMIINGGNNLYKGKALFRSAIMASGSVIPARSVTSAKAQDIFNRVASAAGCPLDATVLNCLRGKDYATFLNAANSVPAAFSYSSLNLSYLPRPDPNDGGFFSKSAELALQAGQITKIPVIIGDQEDEGTIFALNTRNISTDAQLRTYLKSYYPTASSSAVDAVVSTYPNDDGTAGSPFRTGSFNNLYPQYKRIAAIFGDLVFNLQRRAFLNNYCKLAGASCFSYIGTYFYGTPFIGTPHASDNIELYNAAPNVGVAASIATFYTGFINNQDPNSIQTPSTTQQRWNLWTAAGLFLLNFTGQGNLGAANTVTLDNYRSQSYDAFIRNWSALAI